MTNTGNIIKIIKVESNISKIYATKSVDNPKGPFTHTINVTIFVVGTLDIFDFGCKQHHRTVFNPVLNGTKSCENGDIDDTYKRNFTLNSVLMEYFTIL